MIAVSLLQNMYGASQSAVVWTFPTNNEVVGSPAVDGEGRVFIGSEDETFYCVNGPTGRAPPSPSLVPLCFPGV